MVKVLHVDPLLSRLSVEDATKALGDGFKYLGVYSNGGSMTKVIGKDWTHVAVSKDELAYIQKGRNLVQELTEKAMRENPWHKIGQVSGGTGR